MKIDEAEIQKRVNAAQERKKKIDELRLAVLEGHLLMEEALDSFIDASVFHPEQLTSVNMNFHTKGALGVSLSLKRDKEELWSVFWAINQLRNKMAHNLDSREIDEKMKYLRKCYIDALNPAPAAHAKTLSDKEIVESACAVCSGFLGQLTSEAKARRQIIDQHWKGP